MQALNRRSVWNEGDTMICNHKCTWKNGNGQVCYCQLKKGHKGEHKQTWHGGGMAWNGGFWEWFRTKLGKSMGID